MNPKICIILNPAAKGERARRFVRTLKREFPDVHLMLTRAPGHALNLAREASDKGFETIVAAGGDGTLNEVVNGMALSKSKLGIMPIGSVNVFAMELGIPREVDKAVEILRKHHTRKIDLARANNRWFVQLSGVGFDAEIVKSTDLNLKKALGPLSYAVTVSQLAGKKPATIHLRNGKKSHKKDGAFVLIGNGRLYGGPFAVFPDADLEDGLLDVCLFEKISHMDVLRYIQGIILGRHINMEDVHYFKADKIVISSENNEVPVEVDGELSGNTPVEFEVVTKGLEVIVP
ncbi:MAG: diacylglycerol kinase family protein [Verrucomicrobiota bacterium]